MGNKMKIINYVKYNIYSPSKIFIIKKILKTKKPIFIVGCGHSGTTLILSILDYHKDLFSEKNETYIFSEKKIPYFKLWEFINKIKNKRWVEKTPKHVYEIEKIKNVFPKAKIIVMIRDGRDVACSLKERIGSFNLGAKRWVNDNLAWLKYKNDPNLFTLKLETFTNEPESQLKKLFTFLEIEYYNQIWDYNKKKRDFFTNIERSAHEIKRSEQANSSIKSNTCRWKNEISVQEIDYFKKVAGQLLIQLGYEKDFSW